MEKVKQQFGTAVIDGQERKYCQISIVVNDDDAINKVSLTEQFKLIADNFWLYLKAQEEENANRSLLEPDGNIDFDDSFLRKGWF